MELSPAERVLRARLAANTRWSREEAGPAATARARAVFLSGFEKQVDLDRELRPEERARRAEAARKAHFARLALRSVAARRKAAQRNVAARFDVAAADRAQREAERRGGAA